MDRMLSKLEFMLMGLRQMTLSAVYSWFSELKKEDILKALEESPKFKVEGNTVTLKSETELYEEELQKDILKDLMGEEYDDDLSLYDDDLDLDFTTEDEGTVESSEDDLFFVQAEEPVVKEVIEESIVESTWVEAKETLEEVEVPVAEVVQVAEGSKGEDYLNYYYNEGISDKKEEMETEEVVEAVIEKGVENEVQVTDLTRVNGSDVSYEDLIRLIDEYNDSVESKLNYALENKFEVRIKAVKKFYENKYNVRIKEENILDTTGTIFSLIHKKKGMEVAYLVVCETLNESILNYMLDHYDDEVVYFCPFDGTEVDFEVGLNEFYLKDSEIIFDKFLEHYVVVEECDVKVKNLEVIVGTN